MSRPPINGEQKRADARKEARADRTLIPGFPEIMAANPKCRLCALAGPHPDLLRQIHQWFSQGYGFRTLSTKTKDLMLIAGQTPVHNMVFKRHFDNHVVGLLVPAKATPADDRRGALGEGDNDYFEMWSLYSRLRPLLERVYQDVIAQPRESALKSMDVQMVAKIFDTSKGVLEALNRMRNSDRIVRKVVEVTLKYNVQFVADPLGSRLRDLRDRLRAGADAQTVAAEMDNFITEGIVPMFQVAAGQALDKSLTEYRLH